MPLKTTYKEYVLNQLLMEYLKDGTVPTAHQLELDLITYQETHPDLSLPKSKFADFSVERGSSSSAGQISAIAETISNDAGVVVKEIYALGGQATKFFERWSFESKRLAAKAQKLEQRVDSLLLLTNNTAGYFASVGDIFTDMNLTNTDSTTAFVNVDEQLVTLNPGTENAGSITEINTNKMTELDVAFYPLTKRSGTYVNDASTGNNLLKAFKTEDTVWVGTVTTGSKGPMTCELKACISRDKDIEVSKIAIDYTSVTDANKATVTAMHSKDGYNWYIVPTTDATKPLLSNVSWTFPITSMRWIKFIFYKAAHDTYDGSTYQYNFSCRHINLSGSSYYQDRGNLFISKALSVTNTQGNIVGFNLAQLDVCETIPADTNIKYYLAASKDNSTWTSWIDTMPSQREGIQYPKVLNFSGAGFKTSSDTDAVEFNSSFNINTVTTTFDATITVDSVVRNIFQHKFKDATCAINTAIPVSLEEDQDTISNSIGVWRNIRSKTTYPDTTLVRGVARGWGKNEKKYYCCFEILNSDGKLFDFGNQQCILDGQLVSGVIKVPVGIHKFETLSDYWFDISDNLTALAVADVLTEETLKTIDPLYPHNHKLLIEGFPYHPSFQGDKVYVGTDYSAEFYATRTSLFNLENNINDYGYFAVKGVGKNAEAATLAIIVHYDTTDSDYTNELFYTKWRTGQSGNEMYRYIKLKCEFLTSSTALTPAITSYRIKLGL